MGEDSEVGGEQGERRVGWEESNERGVRGGMRLMREESEVGGD